eukprot:COSAG02_NODE_4494_length_5295_cov_3.064088_3_plen_205_part_00
MDDPRLLNELFSILQEQQQEQQQEQKQKQEQQEQQQEQEQYAHQVQGDKLDDDGILLHSGRRRDDPVDLNEWISSDDLKELDNSIARAEARLCSVHADLMQRNSDATYRRLLGSPGPLASVSPATAGPTAEGSRARRSNYEPSRSPWTPDTRTTGSRGSPTSWEGLASRSAGAFSPRSFRQRIRPQEKGVTGTTKNAWCQNLYA